MPSGLLLRIHSPGFQAMSERVLRVTELTSRLNVLPFEDEAGKSELLELILGRAVPPGVTIFPPFYTDHGLNLDLAERVFINQGCTFLDYAGIRLGAWRDGRPESHVHHRGPPGRHRGPAGVV